ncbi:hypothetical protein GCM10009554_24350 [Kribbella koreensis]|uniref:Nuclear transport factor 2 family protein n=1 Tax=Kribbella koreensis TaxID=57909 RepID=A0ABN1Q394_9ACTN
MNRSATRRAVSLVAAATAVIAMPGAANAATAAHDSTATHDKTATHDDAAVHGRTATTQAKSCAQKFDQAQRTDMESFRDFDRDTWLAGHDKGVVSIVADGRVRVGLDAVAAASKPRFISKDSVWSWTEQTRKVDGCKTGFIVYTTKYAIPRLDYWFTAVTAVTYTYKHGRWLMVLDQGTLLEEHVGSAG